MINRYKVQYSQHNIRQKLKDNDIIRRSGKNEFIFNYDNKSVNHIKNMNANVNNALNIFYEKLPNAKINGYEREYLNYSNSYTEKYILNNESKKIINSVDIH